LLIVDEVINSGAVANRFTNSPIPVINWEGFLYNNGRSLFNAGASLAGGNNSAAGSGGVNSGAAQTSGKSQTKRKSILSCRVIRSRRDSVPGWSMVSIRQFPAPTQ
jgi:hypothetical protein